MKRTILLMAVVLLISSTVISQNTYVPDDNFEQALIDLGYDSGDLDDFVPTANIESIRLLNVNNKNIIDLTGIEDFTGLVFLICNDNKLTSLDISQNTILRTLVCYRNQLTSLNIKNGNIQNLQVLQAHNNIDLTCIEVDDINIAINKLNWDVDIQVNFSEDCTTVSSDVYIPDDNFEQTLIDLGYDNVLDNFVLKENINTVTSLNINDKNISDLRGIEAFINLNTLNCTNNLLRMIDVSNNMQLTSLNCANNNLIILNVENGNNSNFTNFIATNNNNLNCIGVDDANYSTTNWTTIDTQMSFSKNCEYRTFIPNDNFENIFSKHDDILNDDYVPTLNIINIKSISISTGVESEKISDFTGLEDFIFLRLLDVDGHSNPNLNVSSNINLEILSATSNLLTMLDLSSNTKLTTLDLGFNQLTNLNIKNGNNQNITSFKVNSNPDLTCIEVDDVAYSIANWTNIDANIFSESCNLTYVPDDNFEQALIDLGYDSDPLDDFVPTANINTVTSLEIDSHGITDLTGIEDFIALTNLSCSDNQLTNLDVSKNTKLNRLNLFINQLVGLDLSKNLDLIDLDVGVNQLNDLDVSKNSKLKYILCNNNNLTNLSLDKNVDLTLIHAYDNELSSLDVSKNLKLKTIFCYNNNLTTIDFTKNIDLDEVDISSNQLTSLDFSQNKKLRYISCQNNQLQALNVKNGTNTIIVFMEATINDSLSCIEVDDVAYSINNWPDIDPQTSFSEDCNGGGTGEEEACVSNTFSNSHGGGEHQFSYTNVKSTILDFDYLDNSFQLEINGVLIHDKIVELENDEFNASTDVHLTFADNSEYEDSRFYEIYRSWLPNSNELPRLRVIIDADGNVTMFGTRTTTSTALEEITTEDGSLFNTVTFLQDENIFDITNINEPGQDGLSGMINIFCNDPVPEEACVSNTFVNGNKGGMHEFIYSDVNSTILDFEYLDNSFQLEINGTLIHNKIVELENDEFNASTDVHLKFADNTGYEDLTRFQEIYRCWLPNTNGLPRLRVIIDSEGNVTMLGTRSTIATELEEIVTEDGSLFNTISFSSNNNVFRITNIDEVGKDKMSGVINIFCTSAENTQDEYASFSKNSETITMYPNPAKNNVTISINEEATYYLVNLSGQVLRKGTLAAGTNNLNVAQLANGLYFLNVKTIKGVTSKKLIKQ